MGSSPSFEVVQPTPPAAPSIGDNISEFVQYQPELFKLQQQQAPLEAQQQLDLLQQYGPQFAQAVADAQSQVNPVTSQLQEDLALQAQQGFNSGLSQDLRDQYASDFKALAGNQVESGLGADFVAKNLLQEDLAFRQFNQNLGLSLAGRQPLAQPVSPQFTNYAGSFTPGQALSYNQGIYGSQLGFSRPTVLPGLTGAEQFAQIAGGVGGLLKGAGETGLKFGCWVAAEIFGGWEHPKTCRARYYINNMAPEWFKRFYLKHGERFAEYISDKPVLKAGLRPLFEYFAFRGGEQYATAL